MTFIKIKGVLPPMVTPCKKALDSIEGTRKIRVNQNIEKSGRL